MITEEAKDEDLKRLLPCPFCGGGITEFHDNGRVWAGMKYSDPISVSVRHWCEEAPGPSRLIERIGKDKEQAIERWNMRSNAGNEGPPLAAHPVDCRVRPLVETENGNDRLQEHV